MRKNNPAVYECPKGKSALHRWRVVDGIATCTNCSLKLNAEDTADMLWVPKDSR